MKKILGYALISVPIAAMAVTSVCDKGWRGLIPLALALICLACVVGGAKLTRDEP